MQAPFVLSMNMGHGAEMVAALLTGVGFGFFLERAGFGRADNLAAVFYGRDFRVLRVMFSAILTAMLGVYFLDLIGFMPISDIGLLPTYIWPQLVGGLLLGAGFVIGGYCPGTSMVALFSGKGDALFFVAGIIAGAGAFTVGYGAFETFHQTGSMGRILMSEYFGIPSGVLVPLVAAFAIGAFYATNHIEAIVRKGLDSTVPSREVSSDLSKTGGSSRQEGSAA